MGVNSRHAAPRSQRPQWVENCRNAMPARISPLRFQALESRHPGIGQPKSRLLGAHCGRSWPARPFSKADTMSAKRFRQLWANLGNAGYLVLPMKVARPKRPYAEPAWSGGAPSLSFVHRYREGREKKVRAKSKRCAPSLVRPASSRRRDRSMRPRTRARGAGSSTGNPSPRCRRRSSTRPTFRRGRHS